MNEENAGKNWKSGVIVGLAVLAAAGLGAVGTYLATRPPKPTPVEAAESQEGLVNSLTASMERVAEQELSTDGLGGEAWNLETTLPPDLTVWLEMAVRAVSGVYVPGTTEVTAQADTAPRTYHLQIPADARLRFCLALDALGTFSAPYYEDTIPPAADLQENAAAHLPAKLEFPDGPNIAISLTVMPEQ